MMYRRLFFKNIYNKKAVARSPSRTGARAHVSAVLVVLAIEEFEHRWVVYTIFHAKLDYFYGAIYSTKFTTTLAGSAISLKANVRANVRRGPNTMKICGRVWGYSSHCLCTTTYYRVPTLLQLQVMVVKNNKKSFIILFFIGTYYGVQFYL